MVRRGGGGLNKVTKFHRYLIDIIEELVLSILPLYFQFVVSVSRSNDLATFSRKKSIREEAQSGTRSVS